MPGHESGYRAINTARTLNYLKRLPATRNFAYLQSTVVHAVYRSVSAGTEKLNFDIIGSRHVGLSLIFSLHLSHKKNKPAVP